MIQTPELKKNLNKIDAFLALRMNFPPFLLEVEELSLEASPTFQNECLHGVLGRLVETKVIRSRDPPTDFITSSCMVILIRPA